MQGYLKKKDIGLRGDINWINGGVDELQVGEGSHVNARAATKGFGNLVKFGLPRLILVKVPRLILVKVENI